MASPGKPTGWRKWVYRLASATVVPALVLLLLELGLRTFGYGYPTRYFINGSAPRRQEAVYTDNTRFGRRFFPPGLVRLGVPLVLPTSKAKDTFRIFVIGESAAMGFPDPAGSFSRVLEVMLRERYPSTRFEVINTAMAAINSHVARPIARECAGHDPDLFIVHLGNNEVVGPFGVAGVIGGHAPNLTLLRANLAAKTTRTGQLIDNLVQRLRPGASPAGWEGMAMYANSHVRGDDPRVTDMLDAFRENLDDICRAGIGAGVPVLLCTVPVNLHDSAPFASEHTPDLTAEQAAQWDRASNAGIAAEEAGRFAEALDRYAEAAAIDASFADLAFRQARCLESLDRQDAARACYERARDLDALRFRSDSAINTTIRGVADRFAAQGVHLVDAERDFAAASPAGVPGEDLFFEHVHMTFKGNYVLARSVFQVLTTQRPPARPPGPPGPADAVPTEAQCAERLAYGPFNRHRAESVIRTMLYDPPFNQQLDRVARDRRWDARPQERQAEFTPERLRASSDAYQRALAAASGDWMLRADFADFLAATGDTKQAIAQYTNVLEEVPHHYRVARQLGNLWLKVGEPERAKACFEAALKSNPDDMFARYDLARVPLAQGQVDTAVAQFTAAALQDPDRAEGLANLAIFLQRLGRYAEARARVEEAFAINPDAPLAHVVMGQLLARDGAVADAIAHYEAAVRSRPRLLPEVTQLQDALRQQEAAKKRTSR
jgi:tetratricopeptide (TPR) repeat protein